LHNPADYTPSVEDERYRKQSMQSPHSSLAPSSTFENRFSLLALLFDFSSPNLSESALNQQEALSCSRQNKILSSIENVDSIGTIFHKICT
jgi:hypothetical protein